MLKVFDNCKMDPKLKTENFLFISFLFFVLFWSGQVKAVFRTKAQEFLYTLVSPYLSLVFVLKTNLNFDQIKRNNNVREKKMCFLGSQFQHLGKICIRRHFFFFSRLKLLRSTISLL